MVRCQLEDCCKKLGRRRSILGSAGSRVAAAFLHVASLLLEALVDPSKKCLPGSE